MAEKAVVTAKASETKQKFSNSCKQNISYSSLGSTADMVLQLQRTAGNQAVQRLIKSRTLQAKLRIGQPNDIYEQEADRVAEQIMRMPEPQAVSSSTLSIQSTCPRCEEDKLRRQPIKDEEKKEKLLQTKEILEQNAETTPDLESRINAIRGGGQPLPESTRAFFEPRFGQDFSEVWVHSGAQAAETSKSINAKAYTVGSNVVFGAGQYAPESSEGMQLLAHELTHTVQQRGSRSFGSVMRSPSLSKLESRMIQRDTDADTQPSETTDTQTSNGSSSAPNLDQEYKTAVNMGDWQAAAEWLNAFADYDIKDRLGQRTAQQIANIHQGALDNPRVGPNSQVAQLTAPSFSSTTEINAGQTSATSSIDTSSIQGTTEDKPISEMTSTEKLWKAIQRSKIDESVRAKILSLITPEALVIAILTFTGIFVASQFTPVGWAADIGIALTGIFVGGALFVAIKHLINFANARYATTVEELDQAGAEFAQAIAEIGTDAIILLLTHGIGGTPKGGVPYEGPSPTLFGLATTEEGVLVPVAANTIPAEMAAQLGIKGVIATGPLMSIGGAGGGPPGPTNAPPEPTNAPPEPTNAPPGPETPKTGPLKTRQPGEGISVEAKWGDPRSVKAYGHSVSEHGPKRPPQQLIDRARGGKPQGQWYEEQLIVEAEQRAPLKVGENYVDMGKSVGRVYLPDGSIVENVRGVLVIRRPNFTVKTSYPFIGGSE